MRSTIDAIVGILLILFYTMYLHSADVRAAERKEQQIKTFIFNCGNGAIVTVRGSWFNFEKLSIVIRDEENKALAILPLDCNWQNSSYKPTTH